MADTAMTGLSAAHERIAAAMYTVDSHPAWPMLRGGTVAGRTLRRRDEAQGELDRLWTCFAALGEQLERARALRAGRWPSEAQLTDLTTLLTAEVVALDDRGRPVEAGATTSTRLTLADFAAGVESATAALTAQLSEVDRSWATLAGEYVPGSAELDALVALGAELGEPTAVAPARAVVEEIERLDMPDPLTAAPSGVLAPATRARLDDLRAKLSGARRELDGVVAARDGYAERRRVLAELIDRVAAGEAATGTAYARVAEKIADAGLPAVPGVTGDLRARLEGLEELRSAGLWRRLAAGLSTVETDAKAALARAAELTAQADGLLARRDELRGRLDALRAKAVGRGMAEDAELARIHGRALDLLFTAPCDLRAATRAVHAYAEAVAGRPASARGREEDDR